MMSSENSLTLREDDPVSSGTDPSVLSAVSGSTLTHLQHESSARCSGTVAALSESGESAGESSKSGNSDLGSSKPTGAAKGLERSVKKHVKRLKRVKGNEADSDDVPVKKKKLAKSKVEPEAKACSSNSKKSVWSELGAFKCDKCGFTTTEEGLFNNHICSARAKKKPPVSELPTRSTQGLYVHGCVPSVASSSQPITCWADTNYSLLPAVSSSKPSTSRNTIPGIYSVASPVTSSSKPKTHQRRAVPPHTAVCSGETNYTTAPVTGSSKPNTGGNYVLQTAVSSGETDYTATPVTGSSKPNTGRNYVLQTAVSSGETDYTATPVTGSSKPNTGRNYVLQTAVPLGETDYTATSMIYSSNPNTSQRHAVCSAPPTTAVSSWETECTATPVTCSSNPNAGRMDVRAAPLKAAVSSAETNCTVTPVTCSSNPYTSQKLALRAVPLKTAVSSADTSCTATPVANSLIPNTGIAYVRVVPLTVTSSSEPDTGRTDTRAVPLQSAISSAERSCTATPVTSSLEPDKGRSDVHAVPLQAASCSTATNCTASPVTCSSESSTGQPGVALHAVSSQAKADLNAEYVENNQQRQGSLRYNESTKLFHCIQCSYKVPEGTSLIEHLMYQISPNPYNCRICKAGFPTREAFQKHFGLMHEGQKVECELRHVKKVKRILQGAKEAAKIKNAQTFSLRSDFKNCIRVICFPARPKTASSPQTSQSTPVSKNPSQTHTDKASVGQSHTVNISEHSTTASQVVDTPASNCQAQSASFVSNPTTEGSVTRLSSLMPATVDGGVPVQSQANPAVSEAALTSHSPLTSVASSQINAKAAVVCQSDESHALKPENSNQLHENICSSGSSYDSRNSSVCVTARSVSGEQTVQALYKFEVSPDLPDPRGPEQCVPEGLTGIRAHLPTRAMSHSSPAVESHQSSDYCSLISGYENRTADSVHSGQQHSCYKSAASAQQTKISQQQQLLTSSSYSLGPDTVTRDQAESETRTGFTIQPGVEGSMQDNAPSTQSSHVGEQGVLHVLQSEQVAEDTLPASTSQAAQGTRSMLNQPETDSLSYGPQVVVTTDTETVPQRAYSPVSSFSSLSSEELSPVSGPPSPLFLSHDHRYSAVPPVSAPSTAALRPSPTLSPITPPVCTSPVTPPLVYRLPPALSPITLPPVSTSPITPPVGPPPISISLFPVTTSPVTSPLVYRPPRALSPITPPPVSTSPITPPLRLPGALSPISPVPISTPPVAFSPVTTPPVHRPPAALSPITPPPVRVPFTAFSPISPAPVHTLSATDSGQPLYLPVAEQMDRFGARTWAGSAAAGEEASVLPSAERRLVNAVVTPLPRGRSSTGVDFQSAQASVSIPMASEESHAWSSSRVSVDAPSLQTVPGGFSLSSSYFVKFFNTYACLPCSKRFKDKDTFYEHAWNHLHVDGQRCNKCRNSAEKSCVKTSEMVDSVSSTVDRKVLLKLDNDCLRRLSSKLVGGDNSPSYTPERDVESPVSTTYLDAQLSGRSLHPDGQNMQEDSHETMQESEVPLAALHHASGDASSNLESTAGTGHKEGGASDRPSAEQNSRNSPALLSTARGNEVEEDSRLPDRQVSAYHATDQEAGTGQSDQVGRDVYSGDTRSCDPPGRSENISETGHESREESGPKAGLDDHRLDQERAEDQLEGGAALADGADPLWTGLQSGDGDWNPETASPEPGVDSTSEQSGNSRPNRNSSIDTEVERPQSTGLTSSDRNSAFYICALCSFSCDTALEFTMHLDFFHHSEPLFPCHHCNYLGKYTTDLTDHITGHTAGDSEIYVCPLFWDKCFYRTHNLPSLCQHLGTHKNYQSFRCYRCGTSFMNGNEFVQHAQQNSIILYTCSRCPSRFREKGAIQQHWRSKHSGGLVYKVVKILLCLERKTHGYQQHRTQDIGEDSGESLPSAASGNAEVSSPGKSTAGVLVSDADGQSDLLHEPSTSETVAKVEKEIRASEKQWEGSSVQQELSGDTTSGHGDNTCSENAPDLPVSVHEPLTSGPVAEVEKELHSSEKQCEGSSVQQELSGGTASGHSDNTCSEDAPDSAEEQLEPSSPPARNQTSFVVVSLHESGPKDENGKFVVLSIPDQDDLASSQLDVVEFERGDGISEQNVSQSSGSDRAGESHPSDVSHVVSADGHATENKNMDCDQGSKQTLQGNVSDSHNSCPTYGTIVQADASPPDHETAEECENQECVSLEKPSDHTSRGIVLSPELPDVESTGWLSSEASERETLLEPDCSEHLATNRQGMIKLTELFGSDELHSALSEQLYHENAGRFYCVVCEKVFGRLESIHEHLFSHFHVPLFSCFFCSYSSGSRRDIKRHITEKHPPEKCQGNVLIINRDHLLQSLATVKPLKIQDFQQICHHLKEVNKDTGKEFASDLRTEKDIKFTTDDKAEPFNQADDASCESAATATTLNSTAVHRDISMTQADSDQDDSTAASLSHQLSVVQTDVVCEEEPFNQADDASCESAATATTLNSTAVHRDISTTQADSDQDDSTAASLSHQLSVVQTDVVCEEEPFNQADDASCESAATATTLVSTTVHRDISTTQADSDQDDSTAASLSHQLSVVQTDVVCEDNRCDSAASSSRMEEDGVASEGEATQPSTGDSRCGVKSFSRSMVTLQRKRAEQKSFNDSSEQQEDTVARDPRKVHELPAKPHSSLHCKQKPLQKNPGKVKSTPRLKKGTYASVKTGAIIQLKCLACAAKTLSASSMSKHMETCQRYINSQLVPESHATSIAVDRHVQQTFGPALGSYFTGQSTKIDLVESRESGFEQSDSASSTSGRLRRSRKRVAEKLNHSGGKVQNLSSKHVERIEKAFGLQSEEPRPAEKFPETALRKRGRPKRIPDAISLGSYKSESKKLKTIKGNHSSVETGHASVDPADRQSDDEMSKTGDSPPCRPTKRRAVRQLESSSDEDDSGEPDDSNRHLETEKEDRTVIDSEQMLQCKFCDFAASSSQEHELQEHLHSKHRHLLDLIKCGYCGSPYGDMRILKKHTNSRHPRKPVLQEPMPYHDYYKILKKGHCSPKQQLKEQVNKIRSEPRLKQRRLQNPIIISEEELETESSLKSNEGNHKSNIADSSTGRVILPKTSNKEQAETLMVDGKGDVVSFSQLDNTVSQNRETIPPSQKGDSSSNSTSGLQRISMPSKIDSAMRLDTSAMMLETTDRGESNTTRESKLSVSSIKEDIETQIDSSVEAAASGSDKTGCAEEAAHQKWSHTTAGTTQTKAVQKEDPCMDGEGKDTTTSSKRYLCVKCTQEHSDDRSIFSHLSRHLDYSPYRCGLCLMEFFTPSQAKKHHSEKHPEKLFSITTEFDSEREEEIARLVRASLVEGADTWQEAIAAGNAQENRQNIQCSKCQVVLDTLSQFSRHWMEDHGVENDREEMVWWNVSSQIAYDISGRMVKSKADVLQTKDVVFRFLCSSCSWCFTNRSSADAHLQEEHPDQEHKFIVHLHDKVCGMDTFQSSSMSRDFPQDAWKQDSKTSSDSSRDTSPSSSASRDVAQDPETPGNVVMAASRKEKGPDGTTFDNLPSIVLTDFLKTDQIQEFQRSLQENGITSFHLGDSLPAEAHAYLMRFLP